MKIVEVYLFLADKSGKKVRLCNLVLFRIDGVGTYKGKGLKIIGVGGESDSGAQSFTFLMADLCQDIIRVS